MNNLLDSKIGATYRLSDVLPFELLVGLDLNLPTGKTRLSSDETKLVMDADLLPVNVYGEGINVNPTITFAKGLNNWTFAVGCGYLWRGSYDFSETLLDYQPGMVINTLAEVRYYYRAKSYTRFFGGYTIYGRDTSEGHDVFNEGNVFQAGVSVSHSIAPDVKVSAGAKGSFREKASLYDKTSGISKDLQAFNGTEAVFDLGGSFALNSTTLLSIPFQARLMTDNGNTGAYYAGAKQKFSLGIGISRELTPSLSADFNLKGFYKHDDETMIPEEIGARSFTGIGVATSLTGRF
jgi:hypothetical protein